MIIEELKDKKIIALTLFLSAGLYHLGFWSTFGINIFSFYNLQEFVISFFYPFLYSIVIFIAIIIPTGGLMQVTMFLLHGNDLEETEYYYSKKEELISKIIIIIFNIIGLIIIFWLLSVGGTFMWVIIPLLIIVFYGRYFLKFLIKKKYIKNEQVNNDIALILITMVTLTFCIGKFNALQIKENVEFDYIMESGEPKKYLGKAGDFFVVCDIDNSTKKFIENKKIVNFEINTFNEMQVNSKNDSLIQKIILKK